MPLWYRRGSIALLSSKCWCRRFLGAECTHPAATIVKRHQAIPAVVALIQIPYQGGRSLKDHALKALKEETSAAAVAEVAAETAATISTTDMAQIVFKFLAGAFVAQYMGRRTTKRRITAAWRLSRRRRKYCMSLIPPSPTDGFPDDLWIVSMLFNDTNGALSARRKRSIPEQISARWTLKSFSLII